MGVDPGLTRCGLSVIESGGGRQVIALDVDVVRTPAGDPLQLRLLAISDVVEHWLDTHCPDVIAIERVFANHNANTAMGTAQAGGVIALAAARRGIDVHFHTPSEVKAAVTGNGNADKAQVTAMVTRILQLQQKPTPADAADALALAGVPHLAAAVAVGYRVHPKRRTRPVPPPPVAHVLLIAVPAVLVHRYRKAHVEGVCVGRRHVRSSACCCLRALHRPNPATGRVVGGRIRLARGLQLHSRPCRAERDSADVAGCRARGGGLRALFPRLPGPWPRTHAGRAGRGTAHIRGERAASP